MRRCDCSVSATGRVTFFAGRIPVAGELVTISYRKRNRAVARLEIPPASPPKLREAYRAPRAGWAKSSARWREARRTARPPRKPFSRLPPTVPPRIAGSYAAINPADIWPGDVLAVTANGAMSSTSSCEASASPTAMRCPRLVTIGSLSRTTGRSRSASRCRRRSPPTPTCRRPPLPRPPVSRQSHRADVTSAPPLRSDRRRHCATPRRRLRSPPPRLGFRGRPRRRPGPALAGPQLRDSPRGPDRALLYPAYDALDAAALLALFERGCHRPSYHLIDTPLKELRNVGL